MVNIYASLSHYFLKVAIRNCITDVEEISIKNDTFRKMNPFEVDDQLFPPRSIIRTGSDTAQQK
jgi:hypothetical protein